MTTEVRERLAQSLHNAVRLTLGMEQQDYRVQRPWSATIAQPNQTPVPLDANTSIVDVFERPELNCQLLILGEPGAGKTTMMLDLASELWQRAVTNEADPIPVLVNLSSWKDPKLPIVDWLLSELKEKYGLRQDLAKQWLQTNQLLPLLDGLDEVAPQHQQACAKAINAWLTGELDQRPCGVLICCRREEFEQVVQQPLNLYGAIYLQPLTPAQIEDYFTQFGLQDVWHTVRLDEALRELLTTPLFLSMFGLVQTQKTFLLEAWQARTTSNLKVEYLLDTYWEATITRDLIIDPNERQKGILSKTYGTRPLPSPEAVQRSLIFVAKALEQESQTELLIERIQPSWLIGEQQRIWYKLLFTLFLVIISALAQYFARQFSEWLTLLISNFLWLKYLRTLDYINPIEKLQFNKRVLSQLDIRYWFAIVVMLPTSLFAISLRLLGKTDEGLRLSFLLVVIITGLSVNRFVTWLIENLRTDIDVQKTANQGIKNSWSNISLFTLLLLALTFSVGLVYRFRISLFTDVELSYQFTFTFAIYIIFLGFFEGGGKALIQHVVLRLVLAAHGYAPLRYDLLLNYCTERLLLQRVGGRYRFMHKLLQNHFANMELK